jgi:hypothetical protein
MHTTYAVRIHWVQNAMPMTLAADAARDRIGVRAGSVFWGAGTKMVTNVAIAA